MGRPGALPAKKASNSWGGTRASGGVATAVMVKTAPGQVGAAAASQPLQGGSATKFMAKQQKKDKKVQQPNNGSVVGGGKKSHKKKEKDELRALAFGK
jgi:hypothetical protein